MGSYKGRDFDLWMIEEVCSNLHQKTKQSREDYEMRCDIRLRCWHQLRP